MNGNVVKVTLWGITVGYLSWDKTNWRTETSIFQFDRDYLSSGLDISPLMMPLDSKVVQSGLDIRGGNPKNEFRGLPPVFADSLPDDRDQADGSGFLINHADCHLISNNAGD